MPIESEIDRRNKLLELKRIRNEKYSKEYLVEQMKDLLNELDQFGKANFPLAIERYDEENT